MKVLVTGACGLMGHFLVDLLINEGHEVVGTAFRPKADITKINKKAKIIECDIRNKEKVFSLIKDFAPDQIYHLAAQSFPTVSWDDPWYTMETNVIGSVNIFEAVKKYVPNCIIMNACTSGEYGFVTADEVPIKEDHALKPLHPYAVSKVAQELLAYQYFKNFGVKSISIRIFNTTGPFKKDDVCADFTKRLVEIEKGINKEKVLLVGDLTRRRALSDVRDTVYAFYLALQKAKVGEVYNVSGENVYAMGDIVEMLRKLVDFKFEVKQDPKLMRPTDEPVIYGDSTKFKKATGWKQKVPIEQTLKDMLQYWRENL